MSKDRYTEPFYATPYSLHQHHLWKTAKNDEKEVFRALQFRCAIGEMIYDNNGLSIRLKRGQACMSYTQMALEANTTVKKARQAINHFSGLNRHGKKLSKTSENLFPLLRAQQKAQLGAQQKTVVDILLDGYYINEGTAKGTAKGTAEGTARAQQGHTNKEAKEAKEPIKENQPPNATKSRMVADALESKGFNEDEIRQVKAMRKSTELILQALHHIFSEGYVIETTPIQALKFAILNQQWKWKDKIQKKDPKEVIMEYFSDGKIYNGYTCGINSKGIWFYSGNYTIAELSFDAPLFKANFQKLCEKINIDNPFEKTIKIKEG